MSSLIKSGRQGKDFPAHMMGKMHKEMRECPNVDNHIYGPDGYCEWHEWTKKVSKTHTQKKCKCGFYCLWEKK